uniref:MerR family DNA-binding protein n=1 Tax=Marinobacterium profundum TaxID=1714300 RepID=UPI001FDFCE92|nr:MerR family DNA-binding protein [Marinobacterium profundum]
MTKAAPGHVAEPASDHCVIGGGVLERLALIALGRSAGFSLDEIAGMLGTGAEPRIDRRQLNAKADELDVTIRRLTAMREGLRHVADCSAPSHLECPRFRRLMELAAAGALGDGRDGRKAPAPRRDEWRVSSP